MACECGHTSQEDSPIGIRTAITSSYTWQVFIDNMLDPLSVVIQQEVGTWDCPCCLALISWPSGPDACAYSLEGAWWAGVRFFGIPSPRQGGSWAPPVSGELPVTAPPPSPHSRVTAATTSCPLKRRSVCSSWRKPLVPWTPRLTAGCPPKSLSKPQLPRVPEHCPRPSLPPRVRQTV